MTWFRSLVLSVLALSVILVVNDRVQARDEVVKPVVLKKGDRIVFLGDSITQGGGGKTGYITLIKNHLEEKHKDLGIEVFNAGISGNKVPDLQRRVEKDVIARKPTIVFIYIGINDVWHGEKDPKRGTMPDAFDAGLQEVIGKIQATGARVIVCTPTVIGEKAMNALDEKLDAYSEISRKLAKKLNLPLCDLRKAFVDTLKEKNKEGKERGVLTTDRVHLNPAGNELVAKTMLGMLGQ